MTANDTQPSSFDTDLTASLEQETKEHFDHETDETKEESDERDERDTSIDTADLAAEQEQQGSQSQAFNPETGEINWDCPCLGGMAHGTCGEQFKSAFSCFVYSEEEPKGMDCVSVFKDMQECFRAHPEEYASELEDNEDEEEESEELSGDVVGFVEDKSDDEDKSDNESNNESNNESSNETDNETDNDTDIEDLSDADHKPRDGASQN